jgi:microcystin-dependent protein
LGYKYKAAGLLIGFQTFALPDLRGRFALGRDDMDNASSINVQISARGATRSAIPALGAITTTFIVKNGTPPTPGADGTINGPFQAGKTLTDTGLDTSGGSVTITTVSNNTPSAGFTTLTVSMPSQPTTYPAVGGLTISSIGTVDGGGGAANRVPSATIIGNVSGQNQRTITTNQMPAHGHLFDDIRWSEIDGSYTYNDPQLGVISVGPAAGSNRGTDYDNGAHFTQHGTYNTGGGLPVDIMNPYQTINYIIFTGRIL